MDERDRQVRVCGRRRLGDPEDDLLGRLAAVSVRALPRRATRASTALREGSGGSWRHQPPVGGAASRATAVERLRSSSGPSCGNNRRSSLWTDSSSGPRGSSSALFHIGPWLHPALLMHIRDASARSAAGPRTPSAMPPAPRRTVTPESALAFALSLTLNSTFRVTAQLFANLANVGRGRVRRRRAARRCGSSLGIRGYASMSGWHFAGADLAVCSPMRSPTGRHPTRLARRLPRLRRNG